MKQSLWILVMLAASAMDTLAETTTQLSVVVSGIASDKGSVYVRVYDSEKTFLKGRGVKEDGVLLADSLAEGSVTIQLALPEGKYALAAYHDENANGDLDANWIGIPKEPTGLSNGHVPSFGPPKFSKAVFEVAGENQIEKIELR